MATLRTSSLNSSRRGSMSCMSMCSGRPPTLWWLLMTALGPPLKDTLSITSGYRVPWASHLTLGMERASRSKTSMR